MAEKEYLLKALTDLSLQYEEGNVEIGGWGGQRRRVEVKVPTRNRGYDIGFSKSGDAYEMIADWWGIKDVNQRQLTQQLSQRYAYHAAKAKLEGQGFALVNEESQADGRIHMVLRRMA
jgi:hypothetical protein